MAFRVRNRLFQIGIVAILCSTAASVILRLRSRTANKPTQEQLELREAAERTHAEYQQLRDQLYDQYMAAIEAFDGNPPKMKEANERLEPLRAKVKELEDKYDRAFERANSAE
jgi:hypothetical protein